MSVLCAEEESAALGVGRLWDAKQFQAALIHVVLGVHLHLPMYMPGVGVCARLVIEKSTRIFLPSRTIEKNVLTAKKANMHIACSSDSRPTMEMGQGPQLCLPVSVIEFLASVASSTLSKVRKAKPRDCREV